MDEKKFAGAETETRSSLGPAVLKLPRIGMSASLVCPHCGYANPEGASFCADCAGVLKPADKTEVPPRQYVRPPDTREAGGPVQCSSCKVPLEQTKDVPFHIGGYAGARRFVIGDLAELAEHLLSVDLYICSKCGNIQLYANQRTKQDLPRALPRS